MGGALVLNSWRFFLVVREMFRLALGLVVVGLISGNAPAEEPKNEASNQPLPFHVKVEKGAAKFLDGDEIVIEEIRGTAATVTPGNIYWIKGTYKLNSAPKATLAAFTTATNADDGKSRVLAVQRVSVEKGEGEFALYLPMTVNGFPHVSFYNGGGFGGVYFGTGETILKTWWGEKTAKKD